MDPTSSLRLPHSTNFWQWSEEETMSWWEPWWEQKSYAFWDHCLSRTNLCFFQSAKKLPYRRQELKTSRRISGYAPITSLRISFGTPSIPGAVFALSLPPALFSSSRVKSSSRRTTQEFRSCLWNGSTCGNKLRTMYLTRSGLSRPGVFLLATNLYGDYFEGETPWVLLDLTDQVFPALKSAFLYASPQSCFCPFPCLVQRSIPL